MLETKYFLDTTETVPDGVGFSQFGALHIFWLAVFAATAVSVCRAYKRADGAKRAKMRITVAGLIAADEIWKMIWLTVGGRYTWGYLPLHLCSINIFLIAWHTVKPNKTLDNFLYAVCIPGALAALVFPSWTKLPLVNFMHLHSFTIHGLLALYPIMLTYAGDIRPDVKMLPKSIALLFAMAVPVYGVNLLLNTNFMFLMEAEPGNPLYIFRQMWGSHLWGFPVIIFGIAIVMYGPLLVKNMKNGKKNS